MANNFSFLAYHFLGWRHRATKESPPILKYMHAIVNCHVTIFENLQVRFAECSYRSETRRAVSLSMNEPLLILHDCMQRSGLLTVRAS
jgi:hypothetical protein